MRKVTQLLSDRVGFELRVEVCYLFKAKKVG